MTGRFADFFRLAGGLLYWNTRKSWFRLRRGRLPCPCQVPSDSGRAFETGCEASLTWNHQAGFRRVCPLLVETKKGLRCSVNAADVRPFWGRAFGYYGGTLLSLYLAAALAIFIFLRVVGYPISIVHLVWPGKWHRVGEVRGWFFMDRSNRAFAAGRPAEGMLYLSNAYEFDPGNYTVASTLAQKLQLTFPQRSDNIYRRLLHDHPDQSALTAQAWFRALLARGDFGTVQQLARVEIIDDPSHASVWMRALLFATRQTGSEKPLLELLASHAPGAAPWRSLLETELLLRSGRNAEARAALNRSWKDAPPYSLFFQVSELINLGDGIDATDRLQSYGSRLDDTARATLLLDAYVALDASQSRQQLVAALLDPPLNAPTIHLLAAHLIHHPSDAILDQLFAKFTHDQLLLADDTLQAYLALYCAAGVAGDWEKMHAIGTLIRQRGHGSTLTLGAFEAFFRGETTQTRIATLLPALPLPLEVYYALLERYPGPVLAIGLPKK